MLKIMLFLPAAMLIAGSSHAESINLVGHVRPVCQIAQTASFPLDSGSVTATLAIFCNSSDGATVSATLLEGSGDGYVFSTSSRNSSIKPGETSDIIELATAYSGSQTIQIAPLGHSRGQAPVVMFQISAD